MMRLSWAQPEDLLPHMLVAAEADGCDIADLRHRWVSAGGAARPPTTGATSTPAPGPLRDLARQLLAEVDTVAVPSALTAAEPHQLDDIRRLIAPTTELPPPDTDLLDRIHGAWLGRAAGCLLGKPVEGLARQGIRALAEATGNWPVRAYFTERGLDPRVADSNPWNRRSRATSLRENISGMPEDDDMNFPLIALRVLDTAGTDFTTDDVAAAWLADLPGGRVFTAERVTYRNLLAGYEPAEAGLVGNPFRDWIGAQIRSDVYGWVSPSQPLRAAELAWRDARLSHTRSGLYGAMFVAAACAASVVAESIHDCIETGLSVVPPASRYAEAVRFGVELGRSSLADEDAIDELYRRYGDLHWVHSLNNTALLVYALARSDGDYVDAVTRAVSGGWDTDSNGATAGSLYGALTGASRLPPEWTGPLQNRLASSVPGFDGIGFDELARRTLAQASIEHAPTAS